MDNSVSNIQLTPEAKRIIEGEIAYQTSGQGFWVGVVIGYVISIVMAATTILLSLVGTFNNNDPQWLCLLGMLWLLLPAWFISGINRSIKNRKG